MISRELGRLGLGSNFISRSLRRKLDCYIATSEAIRSDLLASGIVPERIQLIPNGVDLGEAEPWTRKASRFLYLGRLSTNIERDVPGLLAAFDKVADRHPDAELAVVGGGDLRESTAQLVKRLKYAHKVLLPGTQPAADWLRWADFFVLPSRRRDYRMRCWRQCRSDCPVLRTTFRQIARLSTTAGAVCSFPSVASINLCPR